MLNTAFCFAEAGQKSVSWVLIKGCIKFRYAETTNMLLDALDAVRHQAETAYLLATSSLPGAVHSQMA